jgi:hypothetical protein
LTRQFLFGPIEQYLDPDSDPTDVQIPVEVGDLQWKLPDHFAAAIVTSHGWNYNKED